MAEQAPASMELSLWSSLASWFTPTTLFLFLNLTIATIAISSKLHKPPSPDNGNEEDEHNTHDRQQRYQPLDRSPSNILDRLKSISFNGHKNSIDNALEGHHLPLGRSPSNLLHRLKSINLYNDKPQDEDLTHQEQEQPQVSQPQPRPQPQPTLSRSPSVLHRLKSIKLYNYLSNENPLVSSASPPPATQETATHFPLRKEEEEESSDDDGESDDQLEDLDDRSIEEMYSKLQGKQQVVTRTKSDTNPASGEIPTKLPKKMKKSASTKSAFSHFHESDIVEVEARRPATTKEGQKTKKNGADDDEQVDAKADDFINRFKQQLKLQRMDSIIRYKDLLGRAPAK